MNEGEGRRTLEALYKGPTANFASEGLDASPSIHIKPPTGTTFIVVMIGQDAPPLGLGGNSSRTFLHWMQECLTSATTNLTI
jgi:hypothetical protein